MRKNISLEQLLQCAVMASWQELTPAGMPVVVRVEYHPGGKSPLEFVKIWSSIAWGYWSLICEYWPKALWSRPWGVVFSNGYHSDRLIQAFAAVTQNPTQFPSGSSSDRDGFILVQKVTGEDQTRAEQCLTRILQSADLTTSSAILQEANMSKLETACPKTHDFSLDELLLDPNNPREHITGPCGSVWPQEKPDNRISESEAVSANRVSLPQPAEPLPSYWE